MTKTDITKAVVRNIVGYTTSFTIANLIRRNLQTESTIETVEIYVGSVVVGAMIAESAQKYVDKEIDDLTAAWKSMKTTMKANQN